VEFNPIDGFKENLTMQKDNIQPPRWAQRILQWYCKPSLLEDLQGDLNEYFARHVERYGPRRAKFIYVLDVIKFFRSYTVRKPDFINYLIHWIMIGSYIKSSGRNLMRHKLFSTINIAGLAISMSVGLLIIGMLSDLFSYDKFHKNHSRIYRVRSHYESNGNKDESAYATTSLKAAKEMKSAIAGIEDIAIFRRGFDGDVTFNGKTISLKGFWSNESLFNVFSFELLEGNPKSALKEPFSVILTETSAKKLFGDKKALGKTIQVDDGKDFTVTGILKDVPKASHIKFDMLGSLATREITEKESKSEMAWTSMWQTWTYILLPDNVNPQDLKMKLDRYAEEQNKNEKHTRIELSLVPLDEIMTGEDNNNQIGTIMGAATVWIFVVLSIVVIFSACLNYTNLSIARAMKRTKEVGIRKTIGASKNHVVYQFITESVIISLLALILSFGIFLVVKPHFLSLERSLQELLTLALTPKLVLIFIGFAMIVGFCAGIFPALFFSKINPVRVLKNMTSASGVKGLTGRKVLIVFQFLLSIIGITTTIISYKQYKHFIAYDLGFNTENVLNISLHGNKPELLKKELFDLPEVKDISQSLMITSIGNYYGSTMKNPNDSQDSTGVYYNTVDERYFALHGHKLIAGKNFTTRAPKTEETEVIVNENVLKRFNMIKGNDPSTGLDQVIAIDRKPLRIVGVMRDFYYGRANSDNPKEIIMRYSPDNAQFLNVKILSSDWPATYAKIESIWKKIDTVHPFQAKFYDEQIEQSFAGLKAAVKVAGFLAVLVICIACIGLLGMVVFTTETRLKEVSIRKVLGSTESGLIILLSKSFLILVTVAGAIAIPSSWIFFEKFFLPQIANHAPISAIELVTGFVVVVVLALIMICSQTLKVVRTNPAEILKSE
jgi:putative ABC transport system permease protein